MTIRTVKLHTDWIITLSIFRLSARLPRGETNRRLSRYAEPAPIVNSIMQRA